MNARNELITVAINAVMTDAAARRDEPNLSMDQRLAFVTAARELEVDLRKLEISEPFDLFDPKHL